MKRLMVGFDWYRCRHHPEINGKHNYPGRRRGFWTQSHAIVASLDLRHIVTVVIMMPGIDGLEFGIRSLDDACHGGWKQ